MKRLLRNLWTWIQDYWFWLQLRWSAGWRPVRVLWKPTIVLMVGVVLYWIIQMTRFEPVPGQWAVWDRVTHSYCVVQNTPMGAQWICSPRLKQPRFRLP